MPSPNATFTDIVTTTLRYHPSEIADNVSANNALLTYLKKNGGLKLIDGGYEIALPIEYDTLLYQRYSGGSVLDVTGKELFTAANFPWCQAAVMVTSTGLESRIQNAGAEQIIDLVRARISNAKKSAANNQSIDIYSNGAITNQIGGLALMLPTNGQANVGGINSATYTFWANQFLDQTAMDATKILLAMNALYYKCVRGTDKPNLIVSSQDFFAMFEAALQAKQQYQSATTGEAGFQVLKYKGIDCIFDSNTNFTTTNERMYFLNTDYLKFATHRGTNWVTMPGRESVNQDAEVVPIFWAGQLIVSNRALQGVLFDSD